MRNLKSRSKLNISMKHSQYLYKQKGKAVFNVIILAEGITFSSEMRKLGAWMVQSVK